MVILLVIPVTKLAKNRGVFGKGTFTNNLTNNSHKN